MDNQVSDKSESISEQVLVESTEIALPLEAYAYTDSEKKCLLHHTSAVERGTDNKTVDVEMLRDAFLELNSAELQKDAWRKAKKHLVAHYKVLQKSRTEENSEYLDEIEVILSSDDEEEPRFVTIYGEKIFRAGKWKKDAPEKTIADLEEMAANSIALADWFNPYLKEGHYVHSAIHGSKSIGSVKNVRVVGEYLLADFEMPYWDHQNLIKDKRLRFKSSEILGKIEKNGQSFKNVLLGVALLGSEPPAVVGLGEISTYSDNTDSHTVVFDSDDEMNLYDEGKEDEMSDVTETVETAAPAVTPEQYSELIERLNALESANTALATEKDSLVEKNSELIDRLQKEALANEALLDATRRRENEVYATSLVAGGQLAPAQKDLVLSLFDALQGEGVAKFSFSEDEEATDKTAVELFKALLESGKAWSDKEIAKDHSVDENNLPETVEEEQKYQLDPHDGNLYSLVQSKTAARADELFAASNKTRDYRECLEQASKELANK